ncbi:MAG: DUF134 domain-containing protein [Saccharofermentanales bacterium]
MARPTKWRKIENIPAIPYFIPSNENIEAIPINVLKIEEIEAIRLKDLEGLEQEECAKKNGSITADFPADSYHGTRKSSR